MLPFIADIDTNGKILNWNQIYTKSMTPSTSAKTNNTSFFADDQVIVDIQRIIYREKYSRCIKPLAPELLFFFNFNTPCI